ncbi:MAG: hypothetical protein IPP72_21175 [Chitinophagaceae bacterium]|nr:hypothetical protein [Chitinophagaceae bacterium]
MLKIWITLFLCLAFTGVYAQIEMASPVQWKLLGEVKSIGITIAKMEFHTSGNDTVYFLLMKDFRKQQEINYFSLKFNSTANAFGTLYELLKSFFLNENKKNKDYIQTFRLGQEGVNLQHCTLVARHGVRLTTRDGYINLSEKNIDQLFGIK